MITSVDTNVLLDVFIPDDEHLARSRDWLSAAHNAGDVIICDIVYAELVPAFYDRDSLDGALREIGAHAVAASDSFLTRDTGFFSTYFPEMKSADAPS